MDEIIKVLREFNKERDWEQFHTPENLAKSVAIEACELLECYQWNKEADIDDVKDEVADVMTYCIMLCDKLNIDIKENILRKIEKNGQKYPKEKSKGTSLKYDKL